MRKIIAGPVTFRDTDHHIGNSLLIITMVRDGVLELSDLNRAVELLCGYRELRRGEHGY